jgi:hypothetical protein
MGDMLFAVNIIVPNKYDDIEDADTGMELKKGQVICFLVDDMLQNHIIEHPDYANFIGNIKFQLYDNIISRLTKTGDGILYTLVYRVTGCNLRVGK